jgi:hypothetical protein
MIWSEANKVDDLFGLAKNGPLIAEIGPEPAAAQAESERTASRATTCESCRHRSTCRRNENHDRQRRQALCSVRNPG